MTPRERLIKRANEQLGLNIPMDTPIKSHRRIHRDCGAFSWWFNSKDFDVGKYGSSYTITELLKYEEYELYQDGMFIEILPKDD